MNFSEANNIQGGLPQFTELTTKSSGELTSGMHQTQNIIYTTAAATMNHGKQTIPVSQQNKYPGSIVGWPDPNTLMQLCEKQTINIPNYNGQNNPMLVGVQPNSLPLRIMPNMYLPAASQTDLSIVKQETTNVRQNSSSSANAGSNVPSHTQLQQQSAAMAEYLQKLQATTLPLTLQQLMKLQSDPSKYREKSEDNDKNEQASNNILNIPSVATFRNGQIGQNGNGGQYVNSESIMMEINPGDLNVHIESNESAELGRGGVHTQTDSQTQTHQEKMELRTTSTGTTTTTSTSTTTPSNTEIANKGETRKMKFRAKTGEIKIALGLDGSMLYCCPECSLAFSDRADIEQHIQGHVQERKYQCKECGAMLKRKEHLDQHMRGHSDERPFKCPVCQKAFKRNEHLTRHYVIHSGDKNFTCNVCAKAFSRKDHLNKHAQTHLGVKRTKTIKKESPTTTTSATTPPTTMDNGAKDLAETNNSILSSNDEASNSHPAKQELRLLQHIHNFQKDQNFMQTFSAFKEHALREGGVGGSGVGMLQQQAVNMNEILPQNARYLMPSQLQS